MMNKLVISAIAMAIFSVSASANELSKQNLVERSTTLKSGELQLFGALVYGETGKADNTNFVPYIAYGLTDDLTLGLGNVRYRLFDRMNDGQGFELSVGAGLKGALEQGNEDILGYGADISGKYVLSSDFAFTYGAEYVFWNFQGGDNGKEYRYSIGTLYQPIDDVTLSLGYTYKDLDGFTQNDAYTVSTRANYALSKNMDLGLSLSYSDFDPAQNGFNVDSQHRRNLALYVNYRF